MLLTAAAATGDASEASEMPAPPAVVAGQTRSAGFLSERLLEDADDATVRGVVTGYCSSWKEVTTTTGAMVMLKYGSKLRPRIVDGRGSRTLRLAQFRMKDYVQARIDGAIRVSLEGREFGNRFTCVDGTEQRQFKVSGTHVRCTLCPDAKVVFGTNRIALLDDSETPLWPIVRLASREGRTIAPRAPLVLAAAPPRTVLVGISEAKMVLNRRVCRKPPLPAASSRSARSLPRPICSKFLSYGPGRARCDPHASNCRRASTRATAFGTAIRRNAVSARSLGRASHL